VEHEPPTQFAVQASPDVNGVRVTVSGELDTAVADDFLNIVLKELAGERNLVLDFARVTFCDSSGIRTLVHLYNHQRDAGRTLRIINTTHAVRRVIEMTGLAEYLGINHDG
jgi:stage II sporulation protein AA (anti-sigma F factor antagonist)